MSAYYEPFLRERSDQLGADAPQVVLVSSRDASDYNGLIRSSGARGFIAKAELSGAAVRFPLR